MKMIILSKQDSCLQRCLILTRDPLGSAEQRAPLGVGILPPPPRSRERRNVSTSGKRRGIALGVNSLKHVSFFENLGHGSGQTEVKVQILLFTAPAQAEYSFIKAVFSC